MKKPVLMKLTSVAKSQNGNRYFGTTITGQRVFLPEVEGKKHEGKECYALVVTKTYNQRSDENGQLVACEPWSRLEVTMVGSKEDLQQAKVEEISLELESRALIADKFKEYEERIGAVDAEKLAELL